MRFWGFQGNYVLRQKGQLETNLLGSLFRYFRKWMSMFKILGCNLFVGWRVHEA